MNNVAGRILMVSLALVGASCGPRARGPAADTGPAVVRRDAERASGTPEHESLARDTMERIDAPMGEAFVVPVDPALLKDALASGKPLRLLLDDGLELPSTLYRVSITPREPDPSDPWDRWLGVRYAWQSAPITMDDARSLLQDSAGDGVGFALLVEPKAGRKDNAVWVGPQRVPMQWLPSLETLAAADASMADGPWTSPMPAAARGQGQVVRAIGHEAANPMTRWRAGLLLSGMRDGAGGAAFDDPLLEALARQQEHRMRVAIARLWAVDRGLCERVKQRIAAVAMVSPGVYAPVWETDQAALDRLVLDLLATHTTRERRAQLAEEWLRERPQGAAWIVDEGGSFTNDGPTREPGAVVTLVNLSGEPQTAWAGVDSERAPKDLRPVASMECAVDLRALAGKAGAQHTVHTHVGEWSRSLAVLPMPLAATPPGVVTGLFATDMDAAGLQAGGVASAGDAGWSTAAMIHRPARTETTMPEHRRWEVYVECLCPAGMTMDRSRETLLLFTGEFGRASAAWRIGHDGSITSVRTQDAVVLEELGSEVARAVVDDLPDRWVARIPVPPGSLEDGRLLRIGIEREDARGIRSAWPRPMTPWQDEPARACVDLSRWGE